MELKIFKWNQDADGIVTLTWDDPERSMNVLSNKALSRHRRRRSRRSPAMRRSRASIITSGKANGFCAGAALDEMEGAACGRRCAEERRRARARSAMTAWCSSIMLFRKLETCGKPVVAAINGLALGGGLEVTLACHYRVVADNPKIQLGLPESKVGLLPGGGGTQRLPRLMGAQNALPLIMQGTSLDPQKAAAQKVVHKVVPADQLIAEAKRWIKETPDAVQPWDKKGFEVPGGLPNDKGTSTVFTMGNALYRKTSYNNYPAQRYILSCVYEGLAVPIDAGLAHRGALLHQAADGSGVAEHDPLAVPVDAGSGQGRAPSGERAADDGQEARRARRRHDGRGHRLRVGAGRHGSRADRPLDRRRGEGQGLFDEAARRADREGALDAKTRKQKLLVADQADDEL